MKTYIVWIGFIIVAIIVAFGQWYWHNQNNETVERAKVELENSSFQFENNYVHAEKRTLLDMKVEFSNKFEDAYTEYETTMSQLLFDMRREYVEKVHSSDLTYYQLVDKYQTAAREAEEQLIETFWDEYVKLQDEMEAAGYLREDAFEYELEIGLRIEQITHIFVQELMMLR